MTTATKTAVSKGQILQILIERKWKTSYVIVDYIDCFYALGKGGVEKKFMLSDENITWKK